MRAALHRSDEFDWEDSAVHEIAQHDRPEAEYSPDEEIIDAVAARVIEGDGEIIDAVAARVIEGDEEIIDAVAARVAEELKDE